MSSYGRNFEFRIPPKAEARNGRFSLAGDTDLPIGAPVVATGATDSLGRAEVELAAADSATPAPGLGGVLVYEYGPAAFAGDDILLTTYSDKGTAPVGQAVQVVSAAASAKVVLRNTADKVFLNNRTYTGRNMVPAAALGATPYEVGDLLTPGVGDDTNGYWKKTTDAADAWLVVTKVDVARGEIEARSII